MKNATIKRLLALLLALVMVTALTGFSKPLRDSSDAKKKDSDDQVIIGFSVEDLSNDAFVAMYNGMQEFADEHNIKLLVNDCKSDANNQISGIENFISAGADAIIAHAFQAEVIQNVIDQAVEAGIPVYCWDGELEGATMTVLLKNYDQGVAMGEMAADYINNELDGDAVVGYLEYSVVPVVVERMQGITDTLAELCPDVEVVARADAVSAADGLTATENILQAHPEINVMICVNDAAGLGALEAANAAGRTKDDFAIFASDGTAGALEEIKNGNGIFRGTVDIGIDGVGIEFIEAAYNLVTTGEESEQIEFNMGKITAENVDDYLSK